MQKLNRTISTPINPTALAARSIRRHPGTIHTRRPGGLAGPCGMGAYTERKQRRQLGFVTAVLGGITTAFKSEILNLFGGGGAIKRDAHIPAQELAGNAMIEIADSIERLTQQNMLTTTYLNRAQTALDQIVADFRAFVQECLAQGVCHVDRAKTGLREMEAFQKHIIDGWFKPARAAIGAGPAPPTQTVYPGTQPTLPIPYYTQPPGGIYTGIPGLDVNTYPTAPPAYPGARFEVAPIQAGSGMLGDLPTWAPFAAAGVALLFLAPNLMKR